MRDAPHLCAAPYCATVIDGPARYCATHGAAHTHSGTPGYGGSWRRVRDAYIAAHPACEQPGCDKRALDVHHIDGRHPSEPGANDWRNLQALCRGCHRRETEHAKQRRRRVVTSA